MERNRHHSILPFSRLIGELKANGLIQAVPEGHHISHIEIFEEGERDLRPLLGEGKQSRKAIKDPLITKSDQGSTDQGFEALSEEDIDSIEEEIQREGTDALAWYHPFHWEPRFYWGIYIKDEGINYLLQKVFDKLVFER